MDTSSINIRYSHLAEESCCLSCGSARKFSKPRAGEFCVDLGSGRGTDVLRMAEEVGENGFVAGVDVSEGMLDMARKNAVKLGISNVKFIHSDLETIDLEDNIADLVVSNCTINHITDKQKAWNEVYRILKKGGRFVVSDIYATSPVPEEYKNDPVAVSECWAGADTLGEYMKTILEAGFTDIEVLEESKPYKKGKAEVASFTLFGMKKSNRSCS